MSAPEIHSPSSDAATDSSARAGLSAQPSSSGVGADVSDDGVSVFEMLSIIETCERLGWRPPMPIHEWFEAQLAELERYRVADVERGARERENAVTAQRNSDRG